MTKEEIQEIRDRIRQTDEIDIPSSVLMTIVTDDVPKLCYELEQAQAEIERLSMLKEIAYEVVNRYRKAIDEAIFLTNLDESYDQPRTALAKIKIALSKALEGSDNGI